MCREAGFEPPVICTPNEPLAREMRSRHAARFDFDVSAIFADIRRRQGASGGRRVGNTSVGRPARLPCSKG